MLPFVGMPAGGEWLVLVLLAGACVVVPVALVVWLAVRLARR
jgi:hypothetical protein